MRILVIILCHINILTFHGINGLNNACVDIEDHVPVIDVCVQNEVSESTKVYMNTGSVPVFTTVVCNCTIIPAENMEISINLQIAEQLPDFAFMLEINNVTLNDSESLMRVSNVKINGETQLKYSLSNEVKGGFCLGIASATSDDKFRMICVPNQKTTITGATTSSSGHSTDTTSTSGHSTDTTTELTVPKTQQTKPPNDANPDSETNITLIAIISGSVGGVTLIAVVIISILCYKRKRKPEITEATAPNEPENNDDFAYGMVTNPAYEHFSEVLPMKTVASEDHDTKSDFTNIDSSSHYYSTPIKTDNNKVRIQKIQQDEDDTYDHTATSASGNWTGNEYKRHPINRNGNNCDNENYSVLNPK